MNKIFLTLVLCLVVNQAVAKPFVQSWPVRFLEGFSMGMFGAAGNNVLNCGINSVGMLTTVIRTVPGIITGPGAKGRIYATTDLLYYGTRFGWEGAETCAHLKTDIKHIPELINDIFSGFDSNNIMMNLFNNFEFLIRDGFGFVNAIKEGDGYRTGLHLGRFLRHLTTNDVTLSAIQ